MAVGRVFSCSVILITLISLSVLLRLQTTSFKKKTSHRTRGAYHDPKYLGEYTGNANFQNAQYRAFHLITWRTNLRLLVLAKIKRSQTPTTRYHDCVFTFHPIIKLLHDIELNPGPNQGTSKRQANKTRNNVTVAHLNVRSLKCRDHFIQVKQTVLENKFDILTISESWLDNCVTNLELEIPGYDLYRVDRQDKKGGGVCVYILQSYKTEVLWDISGISVAGFHQLWIKIQVRNLRSLVICTAYRPPDVPVRCFDTDLTPSFIAASLHNKTIYILGDLNCNLLNPENPDSRALLDFCRLYNLSQMVKTPTRVTPSTETLIDVILSSNEQQVRETIVKPCSISDHDIVCATLRLKNQRQKPTYITTRCFKHYRPDQFLVDVSQVPWSVLDVFDDPEDKLNAFNLLFNNVLDEHAPIKTVKIRGRPNPFVTCEIRDLMRLRDHWKKVAQKNKDPHAWSEYKNLCREVKHEIRTAEKIFIAEQVVNNKNNSNCLWRAIRLCIPKKSASQRNYSKDDKIVADEFNNFFSSVGKSTINRIAKLAEESNYTLNQCSFIPRIYPLSEQFTFNAVKCEQVQKIVTSMASGKAPGIDKIPIHVIKDCLPAILPSLTSIINATFEFDTFPLAWKTAEVTPILKAGDHDIPNNNRPISLLPVLSKVCERVAHNQLTSYLLSRGRLSSKQSGNKQWHSTETSVIQTTDEILNAIDKKKLTAVVLLDLSKAFDSIDHQILLAKLQDIGASRPAIKWLGSYLTSRYQFVRINTTLSTKLPVSSGVPQGSILGPLLFNIYVNDLPSVPENCTSQCYVDDTKLLMSFQLRDQHETIEKMNKDLLSIRNWCFDNQLLLNPDKTKLVIFGSRQMTAKVSDFRLFLLGKELEPVKAARDLGVTLDSNLTYNEHIVSTVSSCMSRLGQINRVKHIFNKHALIIIINALVFSKLFYCSSVWSNTTQTNLDKLQAVQNFACRILSGAKKFDHITPLLKDLRWLPIRQQLYFRFAVLVFKCMTSCAPEYLTSKLVGRSAVSTRNTRNSQLLNIPLFRTASGQRTFQYRATSLWNELQPALKLSPSVTEFKCLLRQKLLNDCFI